MEIMTENLTWKDSYKLYTGSILPRPIALVSTISKGGVPNLAPFSNFCGVCPQPFTVAFAPLIRPEDGTKKDTTRNIEETGQFVINIVTEDIVSQVSRTSIEFASDIDEFRETGLTPISSSSVMPYRVKESPIQMECVLENILTIGEGAGSSNLIIGRVVQIHIEDALYKDGKIDLAGLKPVGRLSGEYYARMSDLFTLNRPELI
ncbi:flavin reductase family protein [Paenibacillus sp. PR3]|uniref:Flavin reductase family protein n=1 Tax=Paenibacillus terricola TaxID=2763503 RepID=A0ABR8N366_9BACL|nr:flavin reductase family protein [Paenibacillus terricola]MBD3921269.1 flavin reductase family protein [Paenibacillus terricola]